MTTLGIFKWTDDEIIAAIQRWAREHDGDTPSLGEWGKATRPSYAPAASTIVARFGAWSSAIAAAGLAPRPRAHIRQRTLAERLASHVNKSGLQSPSAVGRCWEWTARRDGHGYGYILVERRRRRVHRVAWEEAHGRSLRADECVLHRCDNPPCINPAHLLRGTHAQNMQERERRDRGHDRRGERNGRAKLTRAIAEEIRARYAEGNVRQVDLAAEYGVAQAHISQIILHKIWP